MRSLPRLRKPRPRPARPFPPSIFDPIYLGIDENAAAVLITLIYKNLLAAGEPGSGKSGALNNICAHAALATDCRLWLMDGKEVELGLWRSCADRFIGPDLGEAIDTLGELQAEMQHRYAYLRSADRRKIERDDWTDAIVLVIDELAYYSATAGDRSSVTSSRCCCVTYSPAAAPPG
ncbi:FtsK/SpoIIIE domain-containing protein [Pseudonocardia abyssalis]|uniref:FtsK/SpoIIIE domain-containing protein n=1 Tax=Pseudonocardia abyssalis TaxID=2792008 RepID=UPI001CF610AD|nr:FtsK/SpoIIIE domain-containing protein [Pseudonocardia abyssalis]